MKLQNLQSKIMKLGKFSLQHWNPCCAREIIGKGILDNSSNYGDFTSSTFAFYQESVFELLNPFTDIRLS